MIRRWVLRTAFWKSALFIIGAIGIIVADPGDPLGWLFAIVIGVSLLMAWAILGFWNHVFKQVSQRSTQQPETLEPGKQ